MIRKVFAVAIAATFIIGIAHADIPLPTVAAGASARNALPVQGVNGGVAIKITCPDGTCSGTGGGGTASSVTVADGTTSTQKLAVDVAGKIGINSLPLPPGAATEATLFDADTFLDSISSNSVFLATGQGSTTASNSGPMVQGAATTAAPTYLDAKTYPLSLTLGGRLRVDGAGGAFPVTIASTVNTNDVVHVSAASPLSCELSDGVNFYAGVKTGQIPASLDASGYLKVHEQGTANVFVSNSLALDATLTGGTAKAIARGGAKGATAAADVTSTANGADHQGLDVQVQNASLACTESGAWSVALNAGSNTIGAVTGPSAAALALDSSVTGLQVAQASTTSGQKGGLGQCAVSTSAPSYTTAQTDPVSCTTSGAVRGDLFSVSGSAVTLGQKAMAASVPVVLPSDQAAIPVTDTPPSITKGTQGSTGFTTQDLKDAGRVIKVLSASNFTAATTEAVITLTPVTDGTAGTAATTFAVTSTKRWRLQSLTCDTRNAGAAVQGLVVKVRMTASGSCIATSPVIGTCAAGTFTATANVVGSGSDSFPDGIEISGTMQVCISQIGTATAGNDVALIGFEY